MDYVKVASSNVMATLDSTIHKASELVLNAKQEGITLTYGYNKEEVKEYGYRYILALRKEVIKAQMALKDLEKAYANKKSQTALSDLSRFDQNIEDNKLFAIVNAMDTNLLKDMATALRNNKTLDVVLLAAKDENKVTFVCATSQKYDACSIVREATKITGGGGGGKKDIAQAGGKDVKKTEEAISHVKEFIK